MLQSSEVQVAGAAVIEHSLSKVAFACAFFIRPATPLGGQFPLQRNKCPIEDPTIKMMGGLGVLGIPWGGAAGWSVVEPCGND